MNAYPKPSTQPPYQSAIQQFRSLRGWSQAALAQRAGVAVKTVNRMDRRDQIAPGRLRGYYVQTTQAVATALEQPWETLFTTIPEVVPTPPDNFLA